MVLRTHTHQIIRQCSLPLRLGRCVSTKAVDDMKCCRKEDIAVTGFHKRPLPSHLVAFSSPEGKRLFKESLVEGNCDGSYFALAEQLTTQSEPAFCGLATLTMVLNALGVDPNRTWKGAWRWFSEEMLDCTPLELVKKQGITFDDFLRYAECQHTNAVRFRAGTKEFSENRFREAVKLVSRGGAKTFLVCSYARGILGQTGGGHFSPVAAYHSKQDLALIMDVARFKYPPHWAPVSLLAKAMQELDPDGRPRGYVLLSHNEGMLCPLRTRPETSCPFHGSHDHDDMDAAAPPAPGAAARPRRTRVALHAPWEPRRVRERKQTAAQKGVAPKAGAPAKVVVSGKGGVQHGASAGVVTPADEAVALGVPRAVVAGATMSADSDAAGVESSAAVASPLAKAGVLAANAEEAAREEPRRAYA